MTYIFYNFFDKFASVLHNIIDKDFIFFKNYDIIYVCVLRISKKERNETMTSSQIPENVLGLPDICPDIYRATDSLDVVQKHIETLEKHIEVTPSNINLMLMKNSLKQYHYTASPEQEEALRKLYVELHGETVNNHPYLHITTSARTKSVLRHYNKCRKRIAKGLTLTNSDVSACRIVLDSIKLSQQEKIQYCYQTADETIIFMIKQGYLPCAVTGFKESSEFDPKITPHVILPEKNYMTPSNVGVIQDFIACPKPTSLYQSLHIVFMNAAGHRIEIQIRTALMHHHAEHYENANHAFYEKLQNKELQDLGIPPINLDRSKVNMSSYIWAYGELSDGAGLEKSSPCMQETHYGDRYNKFT